MCLLTITSSSASDLALSDSSVNLYHRYRVSTFEFFGSCRNQVFAVGWSGNTLLFCICSLCIRATSAAYCFGYNTTSVERSSLIDSSGAGAPSASSYSHCDNSCTTAASRSEHILLLGPPALLHIFQADFDRG